MLHFFSIHRHVPQYLTSEFEVFLTSKLYIIANTTDGQMDGEADRAITEYIPSKDGCIKWHNFVLWNFYANVYKMKYLIWSFWSTIIAIAVRCTHKPWALSTASKYICNKNTYHTTPLSSTDIHYSPSESFWHLYSHISGQIVISQVFHVLIIQYLGNM